MGVGIISVLPGAENALVFQYVAVIAVNLAEFARGVYIEEEDAVGFDVVVEQGDYLFQFAVFGEIVEAIQTAESGFYRAVEVQLGHVLTKEQGEEFFVHALVTGFTQHFGGNVHADEIVALLDAFKAQPATLTMPEIPHNSFAKKLYSTYLSYLPREKAIFSLKMNVDDRGSFTELLRTEKCGQFSVNISKPGITKGQHWHHTKWEFFIVVSGKGLIQQRKVGTEEVLNFEVSGEKIEAIHMLPGFTHNIINLSDTDDLVTVMWANECFDPGKPDTFFEKVEA